MSGTVCQRCAPDSTGQAADNAGSVHRGKGGREAKESTRARKGREDTGASGGQGKRERTGQRHQYHHNKRQTAALSAREGGGLTTEPADGEGEEGDEPGYILTP